MKSTWSCFGAVLLVSTFVCAAQAGHLQHEATPEEFAKSIQRNQSFHAQIFGRKSGGVKPVADVAPDFAYVLMSSYEEIPEVAVLRQTVAQNLPGNVKLVILTDTDQAAQVKRKYSQWISADRLIIATDYATENGFWARDAFPIPVYTDRLGHTGLVSAQYYRDFTSWDSIAKSVGGNLTKENFTFVGGNLMVDEEGNCFSINSYRLFGTSAAQIQDAYGCKTVRILTHYHGIGDADEVIKALPGKKILTNTLEYKKQFEDWGYEVIMLPMASLSEDYRTYANSVIVGNVAFVPAYNDPLDAVAQKVYTDLGYKVFPIPSNELSDNMHGSLHCQVMAYPAMDAADLLRTLGAIEYH